MKIQKQGFTLVELIVVITILAILGTIAIIAFSGYSKNARDSARLSDIGNIKKSLELWMLQSGTYPEPTSPADITYSGTTVWYQGTFGDSMVQTIGKLDKKPIDPKYNTEYTYSVTTSKKEYQIAGVLEKDIAYIDPKTGFTQKFGIPVLSSIIPQVNAASTNGGEAYVGGTYNGILTTVGTSPAYIIALPSIILSDLTIKELKGIDGSLLVYGGKSNLPSSYANVGLTMTGSDFNFTPIEVWSGSTLSELNNQSEFQNFVTVLQDTYKNNTVFANLPEYAAIASETSTFSQAMSSVKTLIEVNISQKLTSVNIVPEVILNDDCSANVNYTYNEHIYSIPGISHGQTALGIYTSDIIIANGTKKYLLESIECNDGLLVNEQEQTEAILTCDTGYAQSGNSCVYACSSSIPVNTNVSTGIPTSPGQAWQTTNSANACHFQCSAGYGFNGTNCVSATSCTTGLDYITLSNNQSWSCKNFGATTMWDGSSTFACTSSTDCSNKPSWAGNYYQWGKSSTSWTNGQAGWNYDWQSPQVNNAWGGSTSDTSTSNGSGTTSEGRQGLCSTGYHIPSVKEWKDACNSISGTSCANNSTTLSAMKSVLKMPSGGYRNWGTGNYENSNGFYWASSPYTTAAYYFYLFSSNSTVGLSGDGSRANGFFVRCLKN